MSEILYRYSTIEDIAPLTRLWCEVFGDSEELVAGYFRLLWTPESCIAAELDGELCAMGHCLITLYEATGEQRYWDILMSKVDYIRNDALRFGDHVLQHTVSANNDFPEQAWADTLFMAAFVLLRVGVKLKDEDMINDALNQWYWHIKYLQNPGNGLYYHGYNNITKDHMSGIYWGRANAWAAYTMSQVGGRLPECYLYPKYMDVAGSLNEQLSALKVLQTENGLWRTVLDDPESYEEISASAGIAAAMLERGNPLHSKYINKSIKGLLANVIRSRLAHGASFSN